MLDINPMAVTSQVIAFVLLTFFLRKFAFGPISAVLDERQKGIQDTLQEIAADRKSMEQARAEYAQRLAGIEAEAREHISHAVKQAQEEAAAILAKARDEAVEQRNRAVMDIEQERKKAIVEIRSQMADLAVVAATRILEREINPSVHREMIGDFITQMGSAPTGTTRS